MERHEFESQIERLKNTFGDRPFADERIKLILTAVKGMSGEWFRYLTDAMIISRSTSNAPLPKDFAEAVSDELQQYREEKRKDSVTAWEDLNYKCDYCRDTGVYLCTSNAQAGLWAFRCHCEKGLSDPRKQIPYYKSTHGAEFTYYEAKRSG